MIPFYTVLQFDPVKPLMKSAMYPVIYRVLTEFVGRVPDENLKAVRRGLLDFSPRTELKQSQQEDGSWPGPEPERTAMVNVFALFEFGADQFSEEVMLAATYLHSRQDDTGLVSGLTVAENAFLLWALTLHGLTYTPQNNRILQRLLALQCDDGGWPLLPDEDQSDVLATIHVLLAMTAYEEYAEATEIRKAIDHLAERIFQPTNSEGFRKKRHWGQLDYAYDNKLCLGWPAPKCLHILTHFGFSRLDPAVQTLIRWLRSTQLPSGLWGTVEPGNEFLTLWVLRPLIRLFFPDWLEKHS